MNETNSKQTSLLMMMFLLLLTLGTLAAVLTVSAQEQPTDCTALIDQAVIVAEAACPNLGRNEICYGGAGVAANGFDGAPVSAFAAPGDRAGVNDVGLLIVGGTEVQPVGVAVLSLGVNLTEEQAMTVVAFGSITLSNGVQPSEVVELPTLNGLVNATVNIRTGPSTDFDVIDFLNPGETLLIDGRNDAGDWVRIRYGEGSAWVFANTITVEGDLMGLEIVEIEGGASYRNPMQRFAFAIGEQTCDGAPESGLLIQAPPDTAADVLINGVQMTIFDTVLIRQNAETGRLRITTLDGGVSIQTGTEAGQQTANPGFTFEIAPGETIPEVSPFYGYEDARDLPLALLPERVTLGLPEGTLFVVRDCLTSVPEQGFIEAPIPAGENIIAGAATVLPDESAAAAAQDSASVTLTFDGQPIKTWTQNGPFEYNGDLGQGFYIDWVFVVPAKAAGEYTLALTTSGTNTDLDGTRTCTVVVE